MPKKLKGFISKHGNTIEHLAGILMVGIGVGVIAHAGYGRGAETVSERVARVAKFNDIDNSKYMVLNYDGEKYHVLTETAMDKLDAYINELIAKNNK